MRELAVLVFLIFSITGCISKHTDPKIKPVKIQDPKPIVKKVITPKVVEPKGISTSYKVTMKTKKFAFSDTGFLVKYDDMIRLNILAMGKPVLDLKVKQSDDICVGSLCNTKNGFNQSFLVSSYPDDLIENVLNKKPIFEGKNLQKTKSGFIQNIISGDYDIKYQISKNGIYFKDRKNRIIMKLRELN